MNTEKLYRKSSPETAHPLQQSRTRVVDNRTETAVQAKLISTIQKSDAKTLPFQHTQCIAQPTTHFHGTNVFQLLSIDGHKLKGPDIFAIVQELFPDASKKIQGDLASRLFKISANFNNEDGAKDFIRSEGLKYLAILDRTQMAKKRGDDTEKATAEIIGGRINRGKNGKDVEWRLIARDKADELKIKYGIETDQELFESWKEILEREDDITEGPNPLRALLSTPIDAFSPTQLALAGGPAKFTKGNPLQLEPVALDRIQQLKRVCELLGYEPVLVFSADTTCEQCRTVVALCDIEVIHLGDPQDDLSD